MSLLTNFQKGACYQLGLYIFSVCSPLVVRFTRFKQRFKGDSSFTSHTDHNYGGQNVLIEWFALKLIFIWRIKYFFTWFDWKLPFVGFLNGR